MVLLTAEHQFSRAVIVREKQKRSSKYSLQGHENLVFMFRMENRTIISIRAPYVDDRGEIKNLLDLPMGSVSVISSTTNAIRANHYHKTDWHYCWMQKGTVDYYHRPVGSQDAPQQFSIQEGQMFYTPPLYEHAMKFTSESVMWCFARNPRTMDDYEGDTARIPSIIPKAG